MNKVLRKLLFLLQITLFLSLTSCVDELNFAEPQPASDSNEKKFKNKFQGSYLCLEDSSILTIEKERIVQKWHIITHMPKDQLDSAGGFELKDGFLYSENESEPIQVSYNADSTELSYDYSLVIFEITNQQVLRYYKGIYFLNFQEADNLYRVKTLIMDKEGILSINRINGSEKEIERIKEFTAVEEITNEEGKLIDYQVRPTRKELKEILNSDLFKEGKTFQKIKRR